MDSKGSAKEWLQAYPTHLLSSRGEHVKAERRMHTGKWQWFHNMYNVNKYEQIIN